MRLELVQTLLDRGYTPACERHVLDPGHVSGSQDCGDAPKAPEHVRADTKSIEPIGGIGPKLLDGVAESIETRPVEFLPERHSPSEAVGDGFSRLRDGGPDGLDPSLFVSVRKTQAIELGSEFFDSLNLGRVVRNIDSLAELLIVFEL